ncbi:hypothetical protein BHE74_00029002 [Ensete ventricosum]|uniref:Uncharacterized protein n=1 Tax=Ensete ventricosum TaxID=4639 RepID=A0A426X9F6_ENSVE|nr:hypothetical protein B296_00027380 [Ensete ventricosum]RWW22699.1 hypothetical protein GW17_00013086 [Ensete ventricosum]RWW63800.1 hypothetical protein BHE74_00029002 [Ensete ventricosum]
MRPARPKNLATKTVAWPCASAVSIHWRHGRSTHASLHPLRSTLQPLQLISFSPLKGVPRFRGVGWAATCPRGRFPLRHRPMGEIDLKKKGKRKR